MTDLQIQSRIEAKILAEIEVMLCRVRLLELSARQASANTARKKALTGR